MKKAKMKEIFSDRICEMDDLRMRTYARADRLYEELTGISGEGFSIEVQVRHVKATYQKRGRDLAETTLDIEHMATQAKECARAAAELRRLFRDIFGESVDEYRKGEGAGC